MDEKYMQIRKKEGPESISRLFIGIRPDQRTQQFLDELIDRYQHRLGGKERLGRIRWISHANRHLTLVFLGETPNRLIPEIESELTKIASALPACFGRIVSLTPFPKQRASALAAELLPNPDLDRLHRHCRQLMVKLGMKPESAAYRPHITLARSRGGFRQEPLDLDFSVVLDNIILYQSHLSSGGSQYAPLFEAELSGNQN